MNKAKRARLDELIVDVTSLEVIKPYPEGYEWIEAYMLWKGYIE